MADDGKGEGAPDSDEILDTVYKRLAGEMPYAGEVKYPVTSMDSPPPTPDDPTGTAADFKCINRFGPLRDFGSGPSCTHPGLEVELDATGQAIPVKGQGITDADITGTAAWLLFPKTRAVFRITKGFRVPYTYTNKAGTVINTSLFVLFSGSGQS